MTQLIKKTLFLACLLIPVSALADEFCIEQFTIAAGEKKTVTLHLDGTRDYINFQLDIYLPVGITIEKNARGKILWTINMDMQEYEGDHTITGSQLSDVKGHYRIIVESDQNYTFAKQKGDIVNLPLVASDQVSTGEQMIKIAQQTLTGDDRIGYELADKECPCEVQINTTVQSLEFASFSWPRDLDFSNSGVKAYIAKDYANGSVQLEEVTKVPAGTGVILNGSAGTYHLQTTTDATDDVSGNMLKGTAEGDYKIDLDNVYVLSNLDNGKPGMYRAKAGVTVKQYKAYMLLSDSQGVKDSYSFDIATDGIGTIGNSQLSIDETRVYNISGQRVSTGSLHLQKGIYVSGGKKYVVR